MEKKKLLFVSNDGLIGDIAWQVFKEGHDVKYCIENKAEADIADGFVPKADDWKDELNWADVVIFDDVGFGAKAQKLRALGKKVIGGTPYIDLLEVDRSFGQEELKKFDIPILSRKDLNNYDDGIDYIKQNPSRYVLKPNGVSKHLLFVGMEEDGSDVIKVIEAYKRVLSNKIKFFQLQKKVTGVEVAVGAFFNGQDFIYPIFINFEHKKLFPGDLGPATGEMGTSTFWSGPNKLFNLTLKKLTVKLRQENYIGYIDLNCIVNGNGIYPLEFTARFGYPTISIQQEGMITPIGDFLYALANGQDPQLKTKKGFQIGVRLVVPPFPYRDKQIFDSYTKGTAIVFQKMNYEGIHIEDVKLVDGKWIVTGSAGVALIVTGSGITMKQAQQQAYNRIENILIPNMYYRTDIGNRWYEDGDRLHSWGYLREL